MSYSKAKFFRKSKETLDAYDRGDIDRKTRNSQLEQYIEWIAESDPDFAKRMKKQYSL